LKPWLSFAFARLTFSRMRHENLCCPDEGQVSLCASTKDWCADQLVNTFEHTALVRSADISKKRSTTIHAALPQAESAHRKHFVTR
jgi:hypothetical protein